MRNCKEGLLRLMGKREKAEGGGDEGVDLWANEGHGLVKFLGNIKALTKGLEAHCLTRSNEAIVVDGLVELGTVLRVVEGMRPLRLVVLMPSREIMEGGFKDEVLERRMAGNNVAIIEGLCKTTKLITVEWDSYTVGLIKEAMMQNSPLLTTTPLPYWISGSEGCEGLSFIACCGGVYGSAKVRGMEGLMITGNKGECEEESGGGMVLMRQETGEWVYRDRGGRVSGLRASWVKCNMLKWVERRLVIAEGAGWVRRGIDEMLVNDEGLRELGGDGVEKLRDEILEYSFGSSEVVLVSEFISTASGMPSLRMDGNSECLENMRHFDVISDAQNFDDRYRLRDRGAREQIIGDAQKLMDFASLNYRPEETWSIIVGMAQLLEVVYLCKMNSGLRDLASENVIRDLRDTGLNATRLSELVDKILRGFCLKSREIVREMVRLMCAMHLKTRSVQESLSQYSSTKIIGRIGLEIFGIRDSVYRDCGEDFLKMRCGSSYGVLRALELSKTERTSCSLMESSFEVDYNTIHGAMCASMACRRPWSKVEMLRLQGLKDCVRGKSLTLEALSSKEREAIEAYLRWKPIGER
jgi:hypothetical protein